MRIRLLATASVLALGLVACGGSDDSGSTGGDTGATAVTIEAGDLFFDPTTLSVSADGVEITLQNTGLIEHDFVIDELGVDIHTEAGETVTETVTLPAGTYDFYCSVPGHREAGMEGTITAS